LQSRRGNGVYESSAFFRFYETLLDVLHRQPQDDRTVVRTVVGDVVTRSRSISHCIFRVRFVDLDRGFACETGGNLSRSDAFARRALDRIKNFPKKISASKV
jgi:hypothetical protein